MKDEPGEMRLGKVVLHPGSGTAIVNLLPLGGDWIRRGGDLYCSPVERRNRAALAFGAAYFRMRQRRKIPEAENSGERRKES